MTTTTLLAAGAATAALAYAWHRRRALDNRRRNSWTEQRPLYMSVGFVVALAAVAAAFEWTVTPVVHEVASASPIDEAVPVTPRTAAAPPPVAPPPPPKPDPITAELIALEDLVEEDEYEETLVELPETGPSDGPIANEGAPGLPTAPAPPPAPTPPPPPPVNEEPIPFAERMPMFPGCEDVADYTERRACAEKAMLKYIYDEVRYPSLAKEIGVQGKAILQFTVEKDGAISDVTVVRSPKAGIDAEARRVVEQFPRWSPGRQGGRPVRVRFTLPIDFRLE